MEPRPLVGLRVGGLGGGMHQVPGWWGGGCRGYRSSTPAQGLTGSPRPAPVQTGEPSCGWAKEARLPAAGEGKGANPQRRAPQCRLGSQAAGTRGWRLGTHNSWPEAPDPRCGLRGVQRRETTPHLEEGERPTRAAGKRTCAPQRSRGDGAAGTDRFGEGGHPGAPAR